MTSDASQSGRPVVSLSVGLLSTYKAINESYYAKKRVQKATQRSGRLFNEGFDDEEGNYIFQAGEEIADRYIAQDLLGKGSFGVVIRAHDHRRDERVAIKIIKNKLEFLQQAEVEVSILELLNSKANDDHNIVSLRKCFRWHGHLCLVFELLAFNLYDLIRLTKHRGVSLGLIRKFASQLLSTLEFLARSDINVIHCDLKPENILLRNARHSLIKLIDFGSSCFASQRVHSYIQSRFYRSPEVLLGYRYDCSIDVWSLACILVELHTGVPLFDGRDEADQLAKIASLLGPPVPEVMRHSPRRETFFVEEGGKWKLKRALAVNRLSLNDVLGTHEGGPMGRRAGTPGHAVSDYKLFVDLLKRMLVYDPAERITPTAARQHPWLAGVVAPTMSVNAASGAGGGEGEADGAAGGKGGAAGESFDSGAGSGGDLRRRGSVARGAGVDVEMVGEDGLVARSDESAPRRVPPVAAGAGGVERGGRTEGGDGVRVGKGAVIGVPRATRSRSRSHTPSKGDQTADLRPPARRGGGVLRGGGAAEAAGGVVAGVGQKMVSDEDDDGGPPALLGNVAGDLEMGKGDSGGGSGGGGGVDGGPAPVGLKGGNVGGAAVGGMRQLIKSAVAASFETATGVAGAVISTTTVATESAVVGPGATVRTSTTATMGVVHSAAAVGVPGTTTAAAAAPQSSTPTSTAAAGS